MAGCMRASLCLSLACFISSSFFSLPFWAWQLLDQCRLPKVACILRFFCVFFPDYYDDHIARQAPKSARLCRYHGRFLGVGKIVGTARLVGPQSKFLISKGEYIGTWMTHFILRRPRPIPWIRHVSNTQRECSSPWTPGLCSGLPLRNQQATWMPWSVS